MNLRVNAGWLSFACLTSMMISVVWAIQEARWTPALESLTPVVLITLLIGLLLGHLRYPRWLALLLGLLAGVETITFQMAALIDPVLDLRSRLFAVGGHIYQWGLATLTGGMNADPLIFVLQLSIILWFVSFLATWLIFHSRQPWWAIALAAMPLLVNLYYARSFNPNGFLVLFAGSALLLLIRYNIYAQEQVWQRARIAQTADAQFDLLWTGIAFAAVLLGATWLLPGAPTVEALNAAWERVNQPWQEFQMQWYRAFSAPQQGAGSLTLFDGKLRLGGPVASSDMRVLDVQTSRPHYWRAQALDLYDGRGWTTSATVDVVVPENNAAYRERVETAYQGRETMRLQIRPRRPYGGLLLTGGQWAQADRPVTLKSYVDPNDTTANPVPMPDTAAVYGHFMLFRGSDYEVSCSYSVADVESLREASMRYPDWVRARFLQLPASLPQRVRDLAGRITAAAPNPYDKASAIEQYLRRNYTYDQTVGDPPLNRDAVDYFLFTSRRGYCTYFASAMTVLCRAVGVPARVATGYTAGERDEAADVYVVRESNAHAWVEVFFSQYGWVEFEPSAGLPALTRISRPPTTESPPAPPGGAPRPPTEREPRGIEEVILPAGGGIPGPLGQFSLGWGGWLALAGVGLAMAVGGSLWAGWHWGLRGLSPVDGVYARMSRLGRLIGVRRSPSQTDHEYARHLSQVVPEGEPEIGEVTTLRVRSHFSRQKPGPAEQDRLWSAWAQLRGKMWAALGRRVVRRIQRE